MANTILESAASGRPVITSDIPGCREAIEDEITGFLCKCKDVKSLYVGMKKFLMLSYDEKRKMGGKARKRMERFFDKKGVICETIEQLY